VNKDRKIPTRRILSSSERRVQAAIPMPGGCLRNSNERPPKNG
jgi:hypothetical protein